MDTLLIRNGTVLTQNERRDVVEDGAVVVEGDTIAAVGPTDDVADEVDADCELDASGHLVVPGFVNPHTHVSDILLRGRCGTDRDLYDWLFNVKQPGMAVMTAADHELAAALYCEEALRAGVTTFVENDAEVPLGDDDVVERKFDAYRAAGVRSVYARGIRDLPVDDWFQALIERITAREPTVDHPDQSRYVAPLEDWFDELDALVEDFHGGADGRHEVWIAPTIVEGMTDEGLAEAYRYARKRDVMTTIHVAEAPQQVGGPISPIEHLRNVGSLGGHALLGHCVHVDDRDVRLLAETDTRVAHNVASNLALGNGFAPVPGLRARGVAVGLGTDNSTLSDTINPLADLRLAALAHKGHHTDPGVIPPQAALDMVTRDAARAVRKADELGTLEAGKRADVVLVDATGPQFTPMSDPVSALVYQALGSEVDTVVCDGEVVVENGTATGVASAYPDRRDRATDAAERIAERSGLADRGDR